MQEGENQNEERNIMINELLEESHKEIIKRKEGS